MRDPGILDPRHFFFPRHFFQRCKVTGELTAEINVKCLGKCGRKMTLIARHFFMKISKVPGNVQNTFFKKKIRAYPHVSLWGIYNTEPKAFFVWTSLRGLNS